MPAAFDPYHQWLGIRDPERPPNHYRLLGIDLFEADPDVVQSAADRQMAHLRTFANGPHSEASQRLLNEVSAARLCLSDERKKAAYDESLRQRRLSAAESAAEWTGPVVDEPQAVRLQRPGRGPRAGRPWYVWAAVIAPLVLAVLSLVAYRWVRDYRALQRSSELAAGPLRPSTTAGNPPAPPDSPDGGGRDLAADSGPTTLEEGSPAPGASAEPAPPTDSAANATPLPTPLPTPAQATAPAGETTPDRPSGDPGATAAIFAETANGAVSGDAPKFRVSEPMGMFLVALAQRDLTAAEATLQALRQNANLAISATLLEQAELIRETHRQFWQAATAAQESISVRQTFAFRGVTVTVTKRGTTYLELEAPTGERKTFDVRRPNIEPDLAIALVQLHYHRSLPTAWRLAGVFLAVDHRGSQQRAEQYLARAESHGIGAAFLSQTIRRLSGDPVLPADAPLATQPTPTPTRLTGSEPSAEGTAAGADEGSAAGLPSIEAQRETRRTLLTPMLAKLKQESPPERWGAELLKQAGAEDLDATARYVLLKAAVQRAVAVRDLDSSLAAIDLLEQQFGLDAISLRYKTLQSIVARLRGDDRRRYADLALAWARQSVAEDDYPNAVRFAQLAQTIGKPVQDRNYRLHLVRVQQEIEQIQAAFEALAGTREQLAQNPRDIDGQIAIARFQCLQKGDFSSGLPALESDTDVSLRPLVQQELSRPASADDQLKLGTGWYDFAQTVEQLEKLNATRRAMFWLEHAIPGLGREQALEAYAQLDAARDVVGRKESELDLTASPPLRATVGYGSFGINQNADLSNPKVRAVPELEGRKVDKFLWACAPSQLEYRLPADATRFSAIGLVNAATQDGVRFLVRVDQKPLFASPPLKRDGDQVAIQVALPEGAQILELIVDPIQNNSNDHAYWIRPQLGL